MVKKALKPYYKGLSSMKTKIMLSLLLSLLASILFATPEQQGRELGQLLHTKGYNQSGVEIENIKQSFIEKPENKAFKDHHTNLSAEFESQFDNSKKGEDPLKSRFAKKNKEALQHKVPNSANLAEVEYYAKQKRAFHLNENDLLFKKYQEISERNFTEPSFLQQEQPLVQAKVSSSEQLFTCRQGVEPLYHSCTKRLIIKAIPQASITKTVTASFTAQCYNLVTFGINLKSGNINVYQCENPGFQSVSVDNPIGEPDYPEQTTIRLLSKEHIGEGGVDFRASGMNPSYHNGFTASFTAFQPKTGRKKSHEGNKNRIRGGRYVWEVTMPRKPLLHKVWEGCEELERKALTNECDLIEQEQHEQNVTKNIPDFSPILEPYWSETKGFLCGGGSDINECESFIKQQCEQVHTKCALFKNNRCTEYENTFKCGADYLQGSALAFNNSQLTFLKEGQENTPGFAAKEFAEAFSELSALTEMGKSLQEGFGDPNNPSVFQGKCSQCRVNIGSFFRDCCKLKGLLQGLIGKCNDEERQLAVAAVKNKRCVKIGGRYCHRKVLRACVEKRDSYCCYGSQLARIIQEIAHQQLNIPWGSAEHPNCANLTVSQLSQLNFDTPFAQQKLAEIIQEVEMSAQEKFERIQKAIAQMGNVENHVKILSNQQAEMASKRLSENGFNHEKH